MSEQTDLLIVGAGPAGMAAAVTARRHGLSVRVVDDQPAPGGQIWRGIETVAATPRAKRLGESYLSGAERAAAFRACGALYEPESQLWQIEPGFRTFVTRGGKARIVTAQAIILATGAQERPMPFPGWTLPGVLTVGAAQILLKTADSVPEKPVWIAGCGPLPLLYMTQLLAAGGRIAGFLDTTPRGRVGAALRHLPQGLSRLGDLVKGLSWSLALRRAGFPIIRHVTELRAEGDGRLQRLRYRTEDGREAEVPAEVLLVHEGVVPNIHAPLALGCAVSWHAGQHCYVPVLDAWGESSQANIFVAGDGAGIGGAEAAEPRGRLAALRVAAKLGRLDDGTAEAAAAPERAALSSALALRPLLDALYAPRPQLYAPPDETLVCRCEEVTAGELRARAVEGRPGPNQLKAFTRAGMGPCQGRQCGYSMAHIVAAAQNRSVEEVGFYRIRPPLKPVTLGELASLDEQEPAA
ncbi:NAD(P)/FAD-dependent oxidoreductase [Bosea sp. (in: a-proteobacteria)]|jgi:NADPH-dependent 2,4-dienoyl-CoA reductase/sulfur reductase-like enzyme|uniref:FAD/NAD(P)-dependent oxidoreductase n=1 Tax=Bosea sp. (in: a-proteobacteria) TaxID=1871050 RepID=UPI002DDCCBAB|nr:NAD(P)/FAD-dependent oxidoreductase [Bosea sp. (in: a-proteobacteria)]HEV2508598.1 NAD(P)/FAD-dependent oxidoreductase [Bosea sp. (in: a-proteobacteria)]